MKNSLKPALAVLLAILTLDANFSCFAADQMLAVASGNEVSAPIRPAVKSVLSPIGYDSAQQLALLPLLEQLYALPPDRGNDLSTGLKRLQLKQKLSDSILIATLQVRDVTARIDKEIARLDRLQGYLQDRRDRALKMTTLGNAFGVGALGEIGQAGEMRRNEMAGEVTELVGGGVTIALSALSLYLQKGQKQRVSAKPNMLSKVFNYPVNKETDYPAVVWNYLNRAPIDDSTKQTRLQSLFQQWRKYEIIGTDKNAREVKRSAMLSNGQSKTVTSIDLIDDQKALLSDLKAEIFQLDRDLLDLLLSIQPL